eukprot:13553100-Alexandrium_andersonii.AAC.1
MPTWQLPYPERCQHIRSRAQNKSSELSKGSLSSHVRTDPASGDNCCSSVSSWGHQSNHSVA